MKNTPDPFLLVLDPSADQAPLAPLMLTPIRQVAGWRNEGGLDGLPLVTRLFRSHQPVTTASLAGPVDAFYTQHALNSPLCFAQAQRFTHGVGNQDLGLTRMINIMVPLPPGVEERRIASEVDLRVSVTEEIEALVERNVSCCQHLRQSILKWAFEGKLVDQDPNDEPAAVLLERIRAERKAAQARKSGNKKRPRRKAKTG